MADLNKFWDRMANKYARQPIADEAAYQHKLDVTRQHFTPQSKVLEFGCGTGSTALLHAPHVKHIHAIDFSARMIEICEGKAADAHVENITFERADITTLEAPPNSYDVVMGMSILHLLEDRQIVIARVFELLRPGGVFISSTACLNDNVAFLKPIAPLGKALGLLPQLNFMTRRQLRQSLIDGGFEIETDWQPDNDKSKAVFIVARKPG